VAVRSRSMIPFRVGCLSGESVKVELPLKGLVFGLLEVGWDDFIYKSVQVVDLEGLPVVDPGNDFGIDLVLVDGLEHLVEFPREWQLGRRQVGILGEAGKREGANVHPRLPIIVEAVIVVVITFRSRFGWQYDLDRVALECIVVSSEGWILIKHCIMSRHLWSSVGVCFNNDVLVND